jgi:GNAT superfamily N-acetyltransferase
VWSPPGAGDDEEMVPALAEVSGEYAETLFEAVELMEEKHPTEPHHYLFLLGTRPEWQSRGIGSALMRPVLEVCDKDGLPAYLEATCERNVQLYLRHGFEVTGTIPLRDGPSLTPMWREPR